MFQEVWGSQAKVDVIMKLFGMFHCSDTLVRGGGGGIMMLFGMFHCSGTLVRRRVGGAQEGGWVAV